MDNTIERAPLQFYVRKTDKNLIEIVEAYSIGKIKIGFRTFNNGAVKGSKLQDSVDFYLSISEFDLLCHNLLSGNIFKTLSKEGGKFTPIYKGSTRDSMVFSRILTFTKSNKGLFVTACEGPGKKTPTGAITPLYKLNDAPQKVSIPLDCEEIKSFAIQGQRACELYYSKGYFEKVFKESNAR